MTFERCKRAGLQVWGQFDKESQDWCNVVSAKDVEALLKKLEHEEMTRKGLEYVEMAKEQAVEKVEFFTEADAEEIYHKVSKDAMKGAFAGDLWEPRVRQEDVAQHFNRILAERGVRVYANSSSDKPAYWGPRENGQFNDTHVGYVVAIEPIARDTAESLLKEMLLTYDHEMKVSRDVLERARRLLERKD